MQYREALEIFKRNPYSKNILVTGKNARPSAICSCGKQLKESKTSSAADKN